jgi:hypothetical protein
VPRAVRPLIISMCGQNVGVIAFRRVFFGALRHAHHVRQGGGRTNLSRERPALPAELPPCAGGGGLANQWTAPEMSHVAARPGSAAAAEFPRRPPVGPRVSAPPRRGATRNPRSHEPRSNAPPAAREDCNVVGASPKFRKDDWRRRAVRATLREPAPLGSRLIPVADLTR